MSRGPFREDLLLAAYAVALGFEIQGDRAVKLQTVLFDSNGIPHDGLQFLIGDVNIWQTSRGWRVARVIDGMFEKPNPSQFYAKLKPALDEGARNWRDR